MRITCIVLTAAFMLMCASCKADVSNELSDTSADVSLTPQREESDPLQELLNSLTLEEKVGQLLFCAFRNELTDDITVVSDRAKDFLDKYHVGGVILFSENIVSTEQVIKYNSDLQSVSKIPLFIGIDEEGGRVTRTGALNLPRIDTAKKIGESGEPRNAYGAAAALAEYLQVLGFNLDFAPIADINTNPKNTVIGNRAFGSKPDQAGAMVSEFVKGLQENGILSSLKHFPGHGDTAQDSHKQLASSTKTLEVIRQAELKPFKAGIDAGTKFVMVGHIAMPNITKTNEPASMSSVLISDILRNELNFSGIIITDAMDMGAITSRYSSGEGAVKAFNAGADMILMPENFEGAYNALITEVKNGTITMERLDDSVYRILAIKYESGIILSES